MHKKRVAFNAFILSLICATASTEPGANVNPRIDGTWHLQQGNVSQVLLFCDGYFSYTVFDKSNKKFISTYGGIFKTTGKELRLLTEFDTRSKENVGMEKNYSYTLADKKLQTDISGTIQQWVQADDATGKLAGVWRITGRTTDGK